MLGLLYKDFYTLRCNVILLTVLELFIPINCFINAEENMLAFLIFPTTIAGVISTSLFSYDEKHRTSIFNSILPCSRRCAVTERYVFTVLFVGLFIIIGLITSTICSYATSVSMPVNPLAFTALLIISGFLIPSIILPVTYKLGFDKSRTAYYIGIMIFALIICILAGFSTEGIIMNVQIQKIPLIPFSLILIAATFIIFALSWLISCRIIRKKDF